MTTSSASRTAETRNRVEGLREILRGAVRAGLGMSAPLPPDLGSRLRGQRRPGLDPLAFMLVPFTDMVLFTLFVSTAFVKRRDREAHKRLMLLAYVSIITAAIVRIPGLASFGPLLAFGLSLLFVGMGMAYDRFSQHRIHPVYLWGGALLFVSIPGRLAFSGTSAWRTVAEFLVR